MTRPLSSLSSLCWGLIAILGLSCGPTRIEGQYPGECSDGIDNDDNGSIDCGDDGCQGSPLCANSDDDDDITDPIGDDDDNDTDPGDDDTDPTTVSIGGDIEAGVYGNGPTADSVVSELGAPDNSLTTGPLGLWTLRLPREPMVGLHAAVPGYIDGHLYLNLSSPTQGARYDQRFTVISQKESLMFDLFLSAAYDPTKGQLFVWADSMTQGSVDGATVSIDRAYHNSFRLTGTAPSITNELDGESPLLFLNVEPGDVNVSVTLPNGDPCEGPVPLPLEPAVISTTYFACP